MADGATVVDSFPASVAAVTWTCAASGGSSCPAGGSGNIDATVNLAVGGTVTFTATGTVLSGTVGPITNTATVSSPMYDASPGNNVSTINTPVDTGPFVSIGTRTKTVLADSGEFVINGAVTYTIILANAGNGTQPDNPGHELVDTLPATLALVSASATSGTAATDLPANTVTWDGSLPKGGSVTVTIHATIKPTVALGATIANQAAVYYDTDGNGTNEATTLTDDPGAPGESDPTSFVVVSPTMDFYTLEPCRLVDTRAAAGTHSGPALVAGGDRVFPLFDRCGIPTTARALSVNLTVTQPTAQGNLRLFPAGTPLPLVSSINYVAGQTRANNAIAPLNGLGELAVRCSQASGTAHFILDVNGYFEEGNR